MENDEGLRDLNSAAWAHIGERRFEEAEVAFRQLIDRVGPQDPLRLWSLFGTLGSILNSLHRPDEATEMFRQALIEARRVGPSRPEVAAARYMLGNQFLVYGDPLDALREVEPIPPGSGHVQCLLHCVAAQALWKLARHDEARMAARSAIDAAPTDERRSYLTQELGHMLKG